MSQSEHDKTVLDQFTKQAAPFAAAPIHQDGMELIRSAGQVTSTDDVLDVACGPGLVACALAPHARHVTGIDMTPRMLEEARAKAETAGVTNVWQVGTATPLPYEQVVLVVVLATRSITSPIRHRHCERCFACARLADELSLSTSVFRHRRLRFDAVERFRDPSHVHALSPDELRGLFAPYAVSDVEERVRARHRTRASTDAVVPCRRWRRHRASCPTPSVAADTLGIRTRVVDGSMWSTWPIRVIAVTKR